MTAHTIETYSTWAGRFRRVLANSDELRKVVFAETLGQLESARKARDLVEEVVDNWRDPETGRLQLVEAMDVKMVSDALGRCADSFDKTIDKLARFAGLIQSVSTSTVAVQISGEKVKLGGDQAAAVLSKSLSFFDTEELRTPGIRARFLEHIGLVDVPMLPGGG